MSLRLSSSTLELHACLQNHTCMIACVWKCCELVRSTICHEGAPLCSDHACKKAGSAEGHAITARGERERERERLHLSSHTGLMQVLPGHPRADTITECLSLSSTTKEPPKEHTNKTVGNEEQLQNMHISTVSKKPRTTHLPWRQTKEASVMTTSNICELCCATTQCKSTNQTMPCGYYNNTSEQAQRFSKCRQRVPQAH